MIDLQKRLNINPSACPIFSIRYALAITTITFLLSCDSDNASSNNNFQEQLIHTKFTCENEKSLNVTYSKSKRQDLFANISFNGSTYKLARVQSASGEKYSDGINTWWSKGGTGFLEIDNLIVLKNCSIDKPIKRMHPSWDINKDSINDCESDGSCDHTIDYSQPRKI